ncbi:MAG: DUF1415 domain-containing protein [Thiotrichales bacterium]|nr:DUF1415 domain-containing protein [Thiotrichales bacterium]
MLIKDAHIDSAMRHWLEQVVIGLNLCPFASRPHLQNLVRIISSDSTTEIDLLNDLTTELEKLEKHPASELETTLIAIPNMLSDFYDYNQFLDWVDQLLLERNWEGIYQVASFHPNYQFGGTQPEDKENLTNRSPYPVLHLIREASMEKAVKHHPDPAGIPERNIALVESLSEQQINVLFPYLKAL